MIDNNMMNTKINTAIIHKVPIELKEILISNPNILEKWNNLTPLARNEWICWITIVKKPETKKNHMSRFCNDILKGKRRPCCWAGCPHRKENIKK